METTPRPWTVKINDPEFPGLTLQSASGLIARFPDPSDPENVANARFIEKASNSYAGMLTALEWLHDSLSGMVEDGMLLHEPARHKAAVNRLLVSGDVMRRLKEGGA